VETETDAPRGVDDLTMGELSPAIRYEPQDDRDGAVMGKRVSVAWSGHQFLDKVEVS
jgi:hypothetical protein